jgi:hypothetical protein
VLSVLNTDLHHGHEARIAGLDPDVVVAREVTPGGSGATITAGEVLTLAPGEARVFVNT